MFFDIDIDIASGWCLGTTWRCTASEAIGVWSVVLYYSTVVFVTIIHILVQQIGDGEQDSTRTRLLAQQRYNNDENDEGEDDEDEMAAVVTPQTRPYQNMTISTRRRNNSSTNDELNILCTLVLYFFTFAGGSLLWVAAGVQWVHPIQNSQIQLIGSIMLLACAVLFIWVHLDLGENWSPLPERKDGHQLVTRGIYQWARHPMYAVFIWAVIATLLSTLNWLIAWCAFGSVLVVLSRIETEERDMVELFGDQYLEYCRDVTALGPPWGCLGYDREMSILIENNSSPQVNQHDDSIIT